MERIEKQPVDLNGKAILVTGAAGFIGNNLCKRLLRETTESVIVGIDCMTDYNPIELKEWRLKDIQETFEQDGIARKPRRKSWQTRCPDSLRKRDGLLLSRKTMTWVPQEPSLT